MFFKLTPLATLLAFAAAPAAAQQQSGTMDHSKMNHGQAMDHGAMQMQMAPTAANPFPPAEMRMHQRMMGAVGATASPACAVARGLRDVAESAAEPTSVAHQDRCLPVERDAGGAPPAC